MFKEDKKDVHPFSNITKTSAAANPPPRTAREEWECVHSYEDALKWHIKWTPWFTKDMIEGVLKYAYPAEILKEGNEKILNFKGNITTKSTPESSKISMHVTVIPEEGKEEKKDINESLAKPMRRQESCTVTEPKKEPEIKEESGDCEISVDTRENRFERFWTLNP